MPHVCSELLTNRPLMLDPTNNGLPNPAVHTDAARLYRAAPVNSNVNIALMKLLILNFDSLFRDLVFLFCNIIELGGN